MMTTRPPADCQHHPHVIWHQNVLAGYMEIFPPAAGRRGADGVDTIEVDIWTSLLPPENYSSASVWSDVEPPDARVWTRTGQFNLPLHVTLLNSTTYLVLLHPALPPFSSC